MNTDTGAINSNTEFSADSGGAAYTAMEKVFKRVKTEQGDGTYYTVLCRLYDRAKYVSLFVVKSESDVLYF